MGWSNDRLKEMEELKNYFMHIRKAKYDGEKYYKVIMNVTDGWEYTSRIDKIPIEYWDYKNVKGYNIFGQLVDKKKWTKVVRFVGIYAVKDKDGIHELVTGELLTPYGEQGKLYCCGLVEVDDVAKIGKDLMFLDNSNSKFQYIKSIVNASADLRAEWEEYCEDQKKKVVTAEEYIQYVKTYRKKH